MVDVFFVELVLVDLDEVAAETKKDVLATKANA